MKKHRGVTLIKPDLVRRHGWRARFRDPVTAKLVRVTLPKHEQQDEQARLAWACAKSAELRTYRRKPGGAVFERADPALTAEKGNRTRFLKRFADLIPNAVERTRANTLQAAHTARRKRRAYLADDAGPGVSQDEWNAILEAAGHACFYCGATGVPLTRDHLVPVCRGGHDEPSNVKPACLSCNSRKSTKTVDEFRLYLERAAK